MSVEWWKRGIIYQVYPRSFQDSNRDGIGDLPGISARIDHLRDLGVDALWISPIYPSPMADFGYDVSDYTDVHPMFGTLADLDELVEAAHARDLKVLLDFVPSHTSSLHPWFIESASSRSSPKRDWYLWEDPAPDGGPPNNWLSRFDGESAWEWHAETGQYYLHSFLAEQPDLNWRNREVRETMFDVMRFWLDRGIDGFRVDVVYRVMKDRLLRDNPPDPEWRPGMDPARRLVERYSKNTPDGHQFNRWIRAVVDEYPGRVLLGEINLPIEELVTHYGAGDEIHLPQNVNLHDVTWTADSIEGLIRHYEGLLPDNAWPNWVLGNHDQHRVASRLGPDRVRGALTLLLTLRGTPILYYGDEIGMVDGEIPADRVVDPWEIRSPGLGLGRDPERTPMQWTPGPQAGFCEPNVEPWLPVADGYQARNVATQSRDPESVLEMVRRLIDLRRHTPALSIGAYEPIDCPPGLVAFQRSHADERAVVAIDIDGNGGAFTLGGLDHPTIAFQTTTGPSLLEGAGDVELWLPRFTGAVVVEGG